MGMKMISLRVDEDVIVRLDALAAQAKIDRSAYLRDLINQTIPPEELAAWKASVEADLATQQPPVADEPPAAVEPEIISPPQEEPEVQPEPAADPEPEAKPDPEPPSVAPSAIEPPASEEPVPVGACTHPKASRRVFSFATICGECNARIS